MMKRRIIILLMEIGLILGVCGATKSDAIPVTINGVVIKLGEETPQEMIEKLELEINEDYVNDDSNKITLMRLNEDDKITADVDNGKVCGICIDCSNEIYSYAYYDGKADEVKTKRNEIVTIGGVCIGASDEEMRNAFGDPTFVRSFNDGFSVHIEYELANGYSLVFTNTGGAIDYMSISRTSHDN